MDHPLPIPGNDVASAPAAVSAPSPLRDLSPRQRCGLGVAAVAVIVGLCWSVWFRTPGVLVPLPLGEPLSSESARRLGETFRAAGLTAFVRSGDRILVPQSQLKEYASLVESPSPAADNWAAEWERQNERLTPFSSSRARETSREIARAKLIVGMLRQLPDVEQADVVWDEDEPPGWRQSPKARATVYLMPKPDRVLTLDVVNSVRLAVAGSKRNLDPADVVVMDLARQITYDGALPATIGQELLPSLRSLAELYRREIRQQILELSDAEVAVSVDLPRFLEFLAEHGDAAATALSAAAPHLLRVNVVVPGRSPLASNASGEPTQTLESRIVALTGIGRGAVDRHERISVQIVPTTSLAVGSKTASGLAGTTWQPRILRQLLATLCFAAIAACVLLSWRRPSRRRTVGDTSASIIPAFRGVCESARQLSSLQRVGDFDDFAHLSPFTLRSLYSHATPRRWAVALRGSSVETRERIADSLEPTSAAELRQSCEQLGPVTLGDIQSSRRMILDTARALHAPVA